MMMGMMSSGILGPFANYLVPIMIGARRMAFPRIEALTFWLLMAAGVVLTTTIFFGGFPTGWTGYAPLATEANPGIDNYVLFFALVGISMTLLGLNMIATILTMRAPGPDLDAAADLRLGRPLDRRADGARRAGADRDPRDGGARPDGADELLHPRGRRQQLPVPEPVLGLRPPGGVHPRPARLRDRPRAAARVRAQAALGLPARGRRPARASRSSRGSCGSTTCS